MGQKAVQMLVMHSMWDIFPMVVWKTVCRSLVVVHRHIVSANADDEHDSQQCLHEMDLKK